MGIFANSTDLTSIKAVTLVIPLLLKADSPVTPGFTWKSESTTGIPTR